MTQTFKVGDKVRHDGRGEVEITYGPFRGQFIACGYVAKQGDGAEIFVDSGLLSAIPVPPKFVIGDKVRADAVRREGEIVAGPFTSRMGDATFWIVEAADGTHSAPREAILTKVEEPEPVKVGDRVRVLRAMWAEEHHGRLGTVTSVSGTWRESRGDIHPYDVQIDGTPGVTHVAELEGIAATTYVYNDVTYELGVIYSDNDGDRWTFERHADEIPMSTAGSYSRGAALSDVVEDFGPLTRV